MNAQTTVYTPFLDCTDGLPLLAVSPGISPLAALDQASLLLASALAIINVAAENANSDETFGAAHLVETSKAIVDSVLGSFVRPIVRPER